MKLLYYCESSYAYCESSYAYQVTRIVMRQRQLRSAEVRSGRVRLISSDRVRSGRVGRVRLGQVPSGQVRSGQYPVPPVSRRRFSAGPGGCRVSSAGLCRPGGRCRPRQRPSCHSSAAAAAHGSAEPDHTAPPAARGRQPTERLIYTPAPTSHFP